MDKKMADKMGKRMEEMHPAPPKAKGKGKAKSKGKCPTCGKAY